jgi:hypothetical protein
VKEGETIVMNCEVTNPDAKAEWWALGKQLAPTQHYKITIVGSIRELQVVSAGAIDATDYEIKVGKASMKCVVQVECTGKDGLSVCCIILYFISSLLFIGNQ